MKKINLPLALLVLINVICGLFHLFFQLDLLSFEGGLREFLLTENIVIAYVFFGFSWALLARERSARMFALSASIFFWAAFVIFVLAIRPEQTTLNLVSGLLIFPQYCYLSLFGVVALALSVAIRRQALLDER